MRRVVRRRRVTLVGRGGDSGGRDATPFFLSVAPAIVGGLGASRGWSGAWVADTEFADLPIQQEFFVPDRS
jgi:hypothetical protein